MRQKKKEPFEEAILGEVEAFLSEFERSGKSEEEMRALLGIWERTILDHSKKCPLKKKKSIERLMNTCSDYANHRGMLERVKQEAEELRLHLGL